MIPTHVIVACDAIGALAFAAGLVLLTRRGTVSGATRSMLAALGGLGFAIATGNVVEWTGVFPRADLVEDSLEPLVPIFWLFMFLGELERADRRRVSRDYEQMLTVHDLATQLTASLDPQAIMEGVVGAAVRLLGAAVAIIFTPDKETGRLVARASVGLSSEERASLEHSPDEGVTGKAFLLRRPVRASDPAAESISPARPIVTALGLTHAVAVPLVVQGRAVGVLSVGRTAGRAFADEDLGLLEILCAHAAVALENAQLYAQMTESEARYRALVENVHAAIIVVDADRMILFWNRGAERLFGWTADEVTGKHISLIYPEDCREDVASTILEPLQRDGIWAGEHAAIRKDGTRFTAFLNLARVFDAKRNTICTLGILSDVTELVRLRQQVFQAQKMETIGALAGGIAHDFNNLLTAIMGFAGILKTGLAPDSDDYESASSIETAALRGTQLVRQLMTFSTRQVGQTEPVNLNEVVREAAELIGRTFPRTISLITRLEPALPLVSADPTQMHQVLMNLAVNARDAMPDGGTITIATSAECKDAGDLAATCAGMGSCAVLTVSDTGKGIDPEIQPHIFEPFFTTKSSTGGTGLGLSTVYAIVTRHGGRISVATAPGRGTTFYIVLPAMRDEHLDAETHAATPQI